MNSFSVATRWRRRTAPWAAAIALATAWPAQGQAPASAPAASASPAPFVMSADTGATRLFRCFERLYTEAFRRLGVPLQIVEHNLSRRGALLGAGAIDGELARTRAYGDAHPDLIRVEEPVFEFGFALFAVKPEIRLEKLEDLAATRYVVEHRRGLLICETELKKVVPPERLSDVPTTAQGVKKLAAGRTDLYCELEPFYVENALGAPELQGVVVRRVLRFATLPTYPYLHEKHAALVPRLTAVLRQMRAEGLLDAYFRDVRLEGGKQP